MEGWRTKTSRRPATTKIRPASAPLLRLLTEFCGCVYCTISNIVHVYTHMYSSVYVCLLACFCLCVRRRRGGSEREREREGERLHGDQASGHPTLLLILYQPRRGPLYCAGFIALLVGSPIQISSCWNGPHLPSSPADNLRQRRAGRSMYLE